MANLIGAAYKWRIDNNVYSYITNTDGGEPFIVSGSTEYNEELIRNRVQNFTKEQYKTKFQEMVSAVHAYNNGKYSYIQFLDYTIYMNEANNCDIYNRPDVVTDVDFTLRATTLPCNSEATVEIYTTDEDIECRDGEKIRKYHIDFGIPKGSRFVPIKATDEELSQNGEQIIRDNDILAGDFVVSVDSTTIWSCGNNYQFINSGVQLNKIDAKYKYFANLNSYSFGENDMANGVNSITEGYATVTGYDGLSNQIEDIGEDMPGYYSHAEGNATAASGSASHVEGKKTYASGIASHAEGYNTFASGAGAHAEGQSTSAIGSQSHSEGYYSKASGENSHAEGYYTESNGINSHAEGDNTNAIGANSHTEGYNTNASGDNSHAEGDNTNAIGAGAHAEGYNTTANGANSHAEGYNTNAMANGSHAEGSGNVTYGGFSHVEGIGNVSTNEGQHISGTYAEIDETGNAIFQVGIGTDESTRKDAFRINKDGSFVFAVPENMDAPIFTFNPNVKNEENSVQTYSIRRSAPRQTNISVTTSNFIDLINLQNKINDAINSIDFPINQEDLDKLKEELSKEFEGIVDGEENDYNEIIAEILSKTSDLQSQIDGEATAWFLKGAPCDIYGTIDETKEPAKDWNENGTDGKESYASHKGDTYTDITEYEDGEIGKSWRFCYCERKIGEGENDKVKDWHWHEIGDSSVARALYEASRAQSTADGKSTVYISRDEEGNRVPDHYQAGDMWIINDIALQNGNFIKENNIYYTKENGKKGTPISIGEMLTANANSKEYNVEHWSKEIKYTDDSYAIEAKKKAEEAYDYAESGHTSALKAIELLNGISSDGRVYPNEFKELTLKKQTIYSEMIELVGVSGNTGEASLWETGVDTADEYYTAAQSAISTLEYYTDENNFEIDTKTQEPLGYIQILNSDENKSHKGYWGNITNYYIRRQELLNDIADASKQYADDIEGIAEQAANAANNAKEAADNAAQSASVALGMLDDVDNDNVVAITEFAALESELEVIERDLIEITNSIELYKNSMFYESLTQFTAKYEILSGSTVSYSGLKTYEIAQKKAVNALKYHCGKVAESGGFNIVAGEEDKNEHGSIIIKSSKQGNVISEPFEIDYENIVNYYGVRQSMLEHIAFVAKLYAESLQTELSPENVEVILRQIKIDGVNLVNGSRCDFEMKQWGSTENLTTKSKVDNDYSQTQINEESKLSFCTDLLGKITNKQWEGEYVSVSMDVFIPKDNITEDEQNPKKVNFGIVLKNDDDDIELFSAYTNDIECVYNDWTRLKLTFSMENDITDVFTKDENDYLVTNVYLVVNDSDSNYKFQEGTTFKFRKIQIEFNTACSSWYPSPEDINEIYSIAADAQQNANSAKEEAEASMRLLTDMSSDDKLTPQEKVNIKKEWGEIQEEYEQAGIDVESAWVDHGFQNPNEYVEYETAFECLDNCLSLVHINSGETTDISTISGTIFGTEYIGREYFNKAFSTYYAKHVAFMNCLAEQLAYLEVRSMKIGGRNLLRNSKELIQSATTNDYTYTPFTPTVGLKPNTNYIFSVDKSEIIPNESSTGFTVCLFDNTIKNARNRLTVPISNTRQTISFKTTSAVTDTDVLLIYVGIHGSTSNKTIKLTNFKLEEGDVATAWSMAPEDQMEYIEEIRDYADSIKTSLQNQIDGVVDSYFMEGEPTISNKPAIDWNENGDNDKDSYASHEGDTYTDISEITLLTSDMWEQGAIKWAANLSDSGADQESKNYVRTKHINIEGCLSLLKLSQEYYYVIFYYDSNQNCLKVEGVPSRDSATTTNYQILKTVSNKEVTSFRLRLGYSPADKEFTVKNAADVNAMINPTAGHSWRWCRGNSGGETIGWHWHKIADSDAVKALQAAAAAQDTADGKRRVFTDQPYTPYDKGDLWIKTDVTNDHLNDTLYCHTGRLTGDFVASDWDSSTAAIDAYNKAESAITSVDYLTEVMQSGTTEINGGLILTNVLALRNTDNTTVTGGMSGVINDNVLLWGGGTYEDAGNAAKTDYLKKDGVNKITTLIKKDGTGKIGVFYIDDDTVKVISDTNTIIITNKDIDEVATFQPGFEKQSSKTLSATITGAGENEVDSNKFGSTSSYTTLEHFILNDMAAGQYSLNGIISVFKQEANGWCAYVQEEYQEETDHEDYKGSAESEVTDLRIRVVQNNTNKGELYSKYSKTKYCDFWYDYQSERDDTELEGDNLSKTKTIMLTSGDVHIYVEVIAYGETYFPANNRDYQYRAEASITFTYSVELKCLEKYSVIARDGIAIIANSDSGFYVSNNTDNIKVIARGLPTYASSTNPSNITDLEKGQLYSLGGVLRVQQ